MHRVHQIVCDNSSVGRALASQAEGRGFESRLSLLRISHLFKRLIFSFTSFLADFRVKVNPNVNQFFTMNASISVICYKFHAILILSKNLASLERKIMTYYEKNKASVNKIVRYDFLKLQDRLPCHSDL